MCPGQTGQGWQQEEGLRTTAIVEHLAFCSLCPGTSLHSTLTSEEMEAQGLTPRGFNTSKVCERGLHHSQSLLYLDG